MNHFLLIMAKIASYTNLAAIELEPSSSIPLHLQLYEALRQDILKGRLKPGARVPPTRNFSKELGISRNTIIRVYHQLIDEGYLESETGSGTRVATTLPESMLQVVQHNTSSTETITKQSIKPHLSKRGQSIIDSPYYWEASNFNQEPSKLRAFSPALPAIDAFPKKLWGKMLQQTWQESSIEDLSYPSLAGFLPLREAVANAMQLSRGVNCSPEQVIITGGAQQALTLSADLLLNQGDVAWVENPCFNGIKIALEGALAKIQPVSIDEEGLMIEEGQRLSPNARLVNISPSHQYPLAITMSLARRLQLLQWAQDNNAWIIENDYDSEFRYRGYPLTALQGLDTSGRVIYLGTFSKVMFPALRLGYMVVPENLIDAFRAGRAHTDRGASMLSQIALAKFISEGHLARHTRRMRALYSKRQETLVQAVQTELKGLLTIKPADTGLHLVGYLAHDIDDQAVSEALLNIDIDAPALSSFAIGKTIRSGLVLGYAAISEDEIRKAVKAMKPILKSFQI